MGDKRYKHLTLVIEEAWLRRLNTVIVGNILAGKEGMCQTLGDRIAEAILTDQDILRLELPEYGVKR